MCCKLVPWIKHLILIFFIQLWSNLIHFVPPLFIFLSFSLLSYLKKSISVFLNEREIAHFDATVFPLRRLVVFDKSKPELNFCSVNSCSTSRSHRKHLMEKENYFKEVKESGRHTAVALAQGQHVLTTLTRLFSWALSLSPFQFFSFGTKEFTSLNPKVEKSTKKNMSRQPKPIQLTVCELNYTHPWSTSEMRCFNSGTILTRAKKYKNNAELNLSGLKWKTINKNINWIVTNVYEHQWMWFTCHRLATIQA